MARAPGIARSSMLLALLPVIPWPAGAPPLAMLLVTLCCLIWRTTCQPMQPVALPLTPAVDSKNTSSPPGMMSLRIFPPPFPLSSMDSPLLGALPTALVACLAASGASVVYPTSPGFTALAPSDNLRVASLPAILTFPTSTQQVAAIMSCATAADMQAVARCGGQSYEGLSALPGSIVLDVRGMTSLQVPADSRTAAVGAGWKLGPFTHSLWQRAPGKAVPLGTGPGVGLTGLLLGGGVGMLTRMHGLASDHLLEAEVVLANSTVVTANASSHPDLYWALRGGGGGNFGIVTRMNISLVDVSGACTYFKMVWDGPAMQDAARWYQDVAPKLPGNTSLTLLAAKWYVVMLGLHMGPQQEAEAMLDASGLATALGPPVKHSMHEGNYLGAAAFFAADTEGYDVSSGDWNPSLLLMGPDPGLPANTYYKRKSLYADEPINDTGLDVIASWLQADPGLDNWIYFRAMGAAYNNLGPDETAFNHRTSLMNLQFSATWQDTSLARPLMAWVRAFTVAVQPFVAKKAYVNYMDNDMTGGTASRYYYGDNLERLVAVRDMYDPTGYFTFPGSISTAPGTDGSDSAATDSVVSKDVSLAFLPDPPDYRAADIILISLGTVLLWLVVDQFVYSGIAAWASWYEWRHPCPGSPAWSAALQRKCQGQLGAQKGQAAAAKAAHASPSSAATADAALHASSTSANKAPFSDPLALVPPAASDGAASPLSVDVCRLPQCWEESLKADSASRSSVTLQLGPSGPDRSGVLPGVPPELLGLYPSFPHCLVQLPMYNEDVHCERVARAACAIAWPRDKLLVQLNDDSTKEDIKARVDKVAAELRAAGHNVQVTRRAERTGFKAGNMVAGLAQLPPDFPAKYVAIFDADFDPPVDFLYQTIYHMETQDNVGFVQTQWLFANAKENWLTRAQALSMGTHFLVDQRSRGFIQTFFGFNGTAGVWRLAAMEQAGGWHADTTVEDMDLSVRAFACGWKFKYLHWVGCPSELPATMAAYRSQQYRWFAGPMQVMKKSLRNTWHSNSIPLSAKLSVTYFFCRFANSIISIFVSASIPPLLLFYWHIFLQPDGTPRPWNWHHFYFILASNAWLIVFVWQAPITWPLYMLYSTATGMHRFYSNMCGLFGSEKSKGWKVTAKTGSGATPLSMAAWQSSAGPDPFMAALQSGHTGLGGASDADARPPRDQQASAARTSHPELELAKPWPAKRHSTRPDALPHSASCSALSAAAAPDCGRQLGLALTISEVPHGVLSAAVMGATSSEASTACDHPAHAGRVLSPSHSTGGSPARLSHWSSDSDPISAVPVQLCQSGGSSEAVLHGKQPASVGSAISLHQRASGANPCKPALHFPGGDARLPGPTQAVVPGAAQLHVVAASKGDLAADVSANLATSRTRRRVYLLELLVASYYLLMACLAVWRHNWITLGFSAVFGFSHVVLGFGDHIWHG